MPFPPIYRWACPLSASPNPPPLRKLPVPLFQGSSPLPFCPSFPPVLAWGTSVFLHQWVSFLLPGPPLTPACEPRLGSFIKQSVPTWHSLDAPSTPSTSTRSSDLGSVT